jgi:hypothetical protein
MRLLPVLRVEGVVDEAATPPPPPWKDREMTSQVMKIRVYQIGEIREMDSPYIITLRI